MKILHICLACFYIDNYSYQENLLPKFHKRLGHQVEIIASTLSFDKNGKATHVASSSYYNEDDIKVTRLPYKKRWGRRISSFFRIYENFNKELLSSRPDIIFIHGCQFMDIKPIINYASNNKIVIYIDNHADFSNSATNFLSKNIVHRILWKNRAQTLKMWTKKFYGVLPSRVDFLKSMYNIPSNMVSLLVMGGDDDLILKSKSNKNNLNLRSKYKIDTNDIVLITGGKIDIWKTQIFTLIEALKIIDNPKIKLIIFGSVIDELKDKFNRYIKESFITYIGWISPEFTYDLFEIGDLIVFPGRHSVLWEQAVAQGKPILVKKWEGTNHIDLGGNMEFIRNDTLDEMVTKLNEIIINNEKLALMKKIAEDKGFKEFSYANIAKKSIE